MAGAVIVLRQAERDLEEIYDFVESHDGPGAAERFRAGLGNALVSLSTLPARGNVVRELRSLGVTDYREIRWTLYRIVYRITSERVVVHCVLDGRRDIPTILQRRLLR